MRSNSLARASTLWGMMRPGMAPVEKGVSDASGREIKLIGESINNFGVVCRTNEKKGVFFLLSGCG